VIRLFKVFVSGEVLSGVTDTLASGYLTEGLAVKAFERKLQETLGTPVLTVSSGTAALDLAYDLAGIGPQSVVISTPMTCLATNLPLLHRGAKIIWADVDPVTGNISLESIVRIANREPGARLDAIVCVDYAGVPCDVTGLRELVGDRIPIIEDAAHAFLALRNGELVGSQADYTAFSFQAIKHLTTGDGGALACRDSLKHEEGKLKRWFGLDRTRGGFRCEQEVFHVGYKYHMNDIAASIGMGNLPYVQANVDRGREHATAYDRALRGASVDTGAAPWTYVVHAPDRERFIAEMKKRGIECARIHARNDTQPIFRNAVTPFPLVGVHEFDDHQVSVPCGWWLSEDERDHIAQALRELLPAHSGGCV